MIIAIQYIHYTMRKFVPKNNGRNGILFDQEIQFWKATKLVSF